MSLSLLLAGALLLGAPALPTPAAAGEEEEWEEELPEVPAPPKYPGLLPQDAAIVAKNFFKPYFPTEVPPPPRKDTEPIVSAGQSTLTGLINDDGPFIALFEDRTNNRSIFLSVGQALGAWTVQSIEMSRMVVKHKDGATQTLELGGTLTATIPADESTAPSGAGAAVTPAASTGGGGRPTPFSGLLSGRSIEDIMRERRQTEFGQRGRTPGEASSGQDSGNSGTSGNRGMRGRGRDTGRTRN
jgi:hypothetical protein